ncbi:hypothetical protein EVG20_g8466 [Dentipellis fragilis]|uniref:Uncharacterized protein n=1 Tax=Dentipellis fragilis TaxID=205917 RepID=A0A4Y9Y775_9AGAM|nr:hypothetical protein EVG20_g8466 [Dentipellis fragilis]
MGGMGVMECRSRLALSANDGSELETEIQSAVVEPEATRALQGGHRPEKNAEDEDVGEDLNWEYVQAAVSTRDASGRLRTYNPRPYRDLPRTMLPSNAPRSVKVSNPRLVTESLASSDGQVEYCVTSESWPVVICMGPTATRPNRLTGARTVTESAMTFLTTLFTKQTTTSYASSLLKFAASGAPPACAHQPQLHLPVSARPATRMPRVLSCPPLIAFACADVAHTRDLQRGWVPVTGVLQPCEQVAHGRVGQGGIFGDCWSSSTPYAARACPKCCCSSESPQATGSGESQPNMPSQTSGDTRFSQSAPSTYSTCLRAGCIRRSASKRRGAYKCTSDGQGGKMRRDRILVGAFGAIISGMMAQAILDEGRVDVRLVDRTF